MFEGLADILGQNKNLNSLHEPRHFSTTPVKFYIEYRVIHRFKRGRFDAFVNRHHRPARVDGDVGPVAVEQGRLPLMAFW